MDDVAQWVQALWRDLADAPTGFHTEVLIVSSDRGRAAPPGWTAIVGLGDAVVVTVPLTEERVVRSALRGIEGRQLRDQQTVIELLRPAETLGPARLFYGTPTAQPLGDVSVTAVEFGDPRVRQVLSDVTDDERNEAGLDQATHGLHLAMDTSTRPVALAGWNEWPHAIAHIGVLTRRSARGHGHARAVAVATMQAAVERHLLPQWRAAAVNHASIAVARRLGLRELGWQFSLRLRGS